MKKITGKTALQRRQERKQVQAQAVEQTPIVKEKITTVGTKKNVTTGTSPVPMRLSENDKADLNLWLTELSEQTGKKITGAKLLRGLIKMRGKINNKKLIQAIYEAN
ncbi:TPA: hypothetical protein ACX6SO_003755 [Photobacterium damselae]